MDHDIPKPIRIWSFRGIPGASGLEVREDPEIPTAVFLRPTGGADAYPLIGLTQSTAFALADLLRYHVHFEKANDISGATPDV